MKKLYSITVLTLLLTFILSLPSSFIQAQEFDSEWRCAYVTTDDGANGTGYNTISVAVIGEDDFAALVNTESSNSFYLVGYMDADSTSGRLSDVEYAASDLNTPWNSGFDTRQIFNANDIKGTSDGKIYLANNDEINNILVYELTEGGIEPTDYRAPLGPSEGSTFELWAIDVDSNGKVYVTKHDTTTDQSSFVVIDEIGEESSWEEQTHPQVTPAQEVTLPDAGQARGITTNSDGSVVFVSNYDAKKVYKYTGSPADGYELDNNFELNFRDTLHTTVDTLDPGPWSLELLEENGILFMAADVNFNLGEGYQYGKIFAVNMNTAELKDTIDVAEWNYSVTGAYNNRPGQIGIASGYTSTYDVNLDENNNLYSQSYFGWTVEKWVYDGELPVLITDIKQVKNTTPETFKLSQNYPNPFNPSTTIEFSLDDASEISLDIYSITGEKVASLISSKHYNAGVYQVSFNAENLASGTYIYSLTKGDQKISKKMTLIK